MSTRRAGCRTVGLLLVLQCALAGPLPAQVVIALRPAMPEVSSAPASPLWATVPDADRVPCGLRLEPPRPYTWVFEPDQPVEITAGCDVAGRRVLLTVWDWNRTPVAQHAFAAPFRGTVRFVVSGRGTYLLTLDQFDGDRCVGRLARSFSVCPSNRALQATWRAAEFQPGCCSFPGRQNWRNDYGPGNPPGLTEAESRTLDADLSARLGLVLVRPDLPAMWPHEKGPIDFTLSDASMKVWTDRGFRLALQIGFPGEADWAILPKYAGVKDPRWRYPRTESAVRRFAQAVAARYAARSAFIEVYNEPDNRDFWRGTVAEFVQTHHWIAAGARKGAPGVPVITGGLCLVEPEWTGEIARGIRGTVDAVGYHSHGGVDNLEAALTAQRALHAAAGYTNPAFYNTEMGYANWRLDFERMSAATAVQKLLYCWAHGNRAGLIYASREYNGPRSSGDWGFLDYTFCPRFSYGAIAAFCDGYAGARYAGTVVAQNGLYAYRFAKAGRTLVPVFVAQDSPRPVKLATDAASAQLVDPMGNAAPLPIEGGVVMLTAGVYPQTLVLEGATRVALKD